MGLPRPEHDRSTDVYGTHGETDLLHYHLHQITDGQTHFDNRETTVAHAFGVPHAAIGGLTFGARLYERLHGFRSHQPEDTIVEVGCGTGEMALGWMQQNSHSATSTYIRVDLSPELLKTQAHRVPTTCGVHGNAMALPLRANSVDVLLSNEVIADLPAVPVVPHALNDASRSVLLDLKHYDIPEPQEPMIFNQGTWRFLEEIARVLALGVLPMCPNLGVRNMLPKKRYNWTTLK